MIWINKKYESMNESINESINKLHITLRDLFKDDFEKWRKDFQQKAALTTNFDTFILNNLSVCGVNIKFGEQYSHGWKHLEIGPHQIRGYECAINGENPFMDEIIVPGLGTEIGMVSNDLYNFMIGYYNSMRDNFIMNFEPRADSFKNKGSKVNKTLKELFINDTAYTDSIETRPVNNIKCLEELFINETSFIKAIKALQNLKVIADDNSNLIGTKLKGVMQVWIHILKNDRRLLKAVSDKDLTVLLNQHFTNLNISEKSDGKHFRNRVNKTASNLYRAKLLVLI